jgi:hypothetical protein
MDGTAAAVAGCRGSGRDRTAVGRISDGADGRMARRSVGAIDRVRDRMIGGLKGSADTVCDRGRCASQNFARPRPFPVLSLVALYSQPVCPCATP